MIFLDIISKADKSLNEAYLRKHPSEARGRRLAILVKNALAHIFISYFLCLDPRCSTKGLQGPKWV